MNIQKDEYGEFYKGYISLSNGKPLIQQLEKNSKKLLSILGSISEQDSLFRYDEGKWSVRELTGHIVDTERIFCFRALAIARGDERELPGYDQDIYVDNARFDDQSFKNIVNQYRVTRETTIALFSSFSETDMMKSGKVNNSEFTVRALGYVIAGHELHHFSVVKEKYLSAMGK